MDLILWRHAEAHVIKAGQSDLDRALTSKGERQAQRMAEWLNQRLAHSTRILVSPALRTQQTAKALDRKFKTVQALAPDASPVALLGAVGGGGGPGPGGGGGGAPPARGGGGGGLFFLLWDSRLEDEGRPSPNPLPLAGEGFSNAGWRSTVSLFPYE